MILKPHSHRWLGKWGGKNRQLSFTTYIKPAIQLEGAFHMLWSQCFVAQPLQIWHVELTSGAACQNRLTNLKCDVLQPRFKKYHVVCCSMFISLVKAVLFPWSNEWAVTNAPHRNVLESQGNVHVPV